MSTEAVDDEQTQLEREAADPRTAPGRLTELAKMSCWSRVGPGGLPPEEPVHPDDLRVRLLVATNPNTPIETLLDLTVDFPEEVWHNPAFALALLEAPDLLEREPVLALVHLLTLQPLPSGLLRAARASSQESVMLALASHPETPLDLLQHLVEEFPGCWYEAVVNAVKLHVNYSNTGFSPVGAFERNLLGPVRAPVSRFSPVGAFERNLLGPVRAPVSLEETFLGLAGAVSPLLFSSFPEAVPLMLASSCAPAALLEQFVKGNELIVAANPATPPALLERLAGDDRAEVRELVEANPATPVELRERLQAGFGAHRGAVLPELAQSPWAWVRQAIASNPATPASVLASLGQDVSPAVRLAVAANPSTPASTLRQLIEIIPSTQLQPDTDLEPARLPPQQRSGQMSGATWLWPDVNLAEYLHDHRVYQAVAGNPATPPKLLELLADHPNTDVKVAVASHPNTPAECVEWLFLQSEFESRVRLAAISNPRLPFELVEEQALATLTDVHPHLLRRLDLDSRWIEKIFELEGHRLDVQLGIAAQPATPAPILEKLALAIEPVRLLVAQHPNTPATTLASLVGELDPGIHSAAQQHPALPAEVLVELDAALAQARRGEELEILASSRWPLVRLEVARSEHCPAHLLQSLAGERSVWVLEAVASHPHTSPEVLASLATNSASEAAAVRHLVAAHPATPARVLTTLAHNPDPIVRLTVARHPNLPPYAQHILASGCPQVQEVLATNLRLHPEILVELACGQAPGPVRTAAAANPAFPAQAQEQLQALQAIEASAASPATTVEQLERLSRHERPWIRQLVAANPSTPARTLAYLLNDGIESVRTQAAANPTALTMLLSYCARGSEPSITRLNAFLHPQTPPELLGRALRSYCWQERYAVAIHPNTPETVRRRLAGDANRLVRAAARERLPQAADT